MEYSENLSFQHYFLSLVLVVTLTTLPVLIANLMYIIAIIVSGIKPLKAHIMPLNLKA